tara:strand:+ start:300 stop:1772 length:1473 start_codon:yes stop_codon:yes gene_type:complete
MGDNIYQKPDGDIMGLSFYKCPINSTHNTLIRHRSILRESVMTELNCRVIEIVLSTLKYPVFMEIDMKGHEAKSAGATGAAGDGADTGAGTGGDAADAAGAAGGTEDKKDCNPTEGICKIRHGFTGTSNLLDFLKTVCHAYSKCFERDLKPYPLILGFDVTGNSTCDNGIFNEITKLITDCDNVIQDSKSLVCTGEKKIEKKFSGSLVTTLYGDADNLFESEGGDTSSPAEFFKFIKDIGGTGGNTSIGGGDRQVLSGLPENSNTDNTAECSDKTLRELMGKIILRCKGKTLIDKLKTNDICHIDYQSSLKIQVNTFNTVKYPELKYNREGKKLLRVYPGFNFNIRALSYQKTISNEIKKRLNQLFNEPKSSPAQGGNNPGSSSSAPKGVQLHLTTGKFELDLSDEKDLNLAKLKYVDITPKTVGNITTCYGHDILKYINIVSYNYPLKTEKDKPFQELDDNFYRFYNGSEGERKTKYDNLIKSLVTSPE